MTTFADTILPISTSQQAPALQQRIPSPWLMWLVAVSFVIFQFLLQLSAGVLINQMTDSFRLTPVGIGLLASAFYLVYVSLQTPAGILVDRLGPRRLLTGGGFVCALGCLLFTVSHSFALAFIGRLLMGGGSSFAFVSSMTIASSWFPPTRFAMMLGLAETLGMLGTLAGNVYVANLLQHIPWRDVMWGNTLFAFLLGILCWTIIRDKPRSTHSPDATQCMREFSKEVIWLLKNWGLFFNGLYTGFVFAVISVFASLWVIPYLVLSQQVTTVTATFESSLIFVGLAVTCPLMGWLYPRITAKNYFLAGFALLTALICTLIIFTTPQSILGCGLLFLLLGCACSSYVFNFSLANELVPPHIQATSVGYTNTLCMITAPLLQPLVGWVLQVTSTNQPSITLTNYHWALSLIPICLIVAAVISFRIPKVDRLLLKTNDFDKLNNLRVQKKNQVLAA